MRTEKDYLGERQIKDDVLYGIHSIRAKENFPDHSPFPLEWYEAMGTVKRACYITIADFYQKAETKYQLLHEKLHRISSEKLEALLKVAVECESGKYFEHYIVPAVSGGAGTSINMNCNEIIANAALLTLGFSPGNYQQIDPVEDANLFQSTNDVVPTALKIAIIRLLNKLEESINLTRQSTEELEKKYRNHLRMGYTQMQEAVPTTFGRLFGAYSEALSRDWWRISKCIERIKVVNLGGSAIGTSITVPAYFVAEVVKNLRNISGFPVTQTENYGDTTSNLDSLVEVHGIIKSHAVSLEKMANDLRLLSASIVHPTTLQIPSRQVGSSIMPGKINPVIPEFIISAVHRVYANDSLITSLSAQGCLELNAYLPIIGCSFIESLKLLLACNESILKNMLSDIIINSENSLLQVYNSPAITTALIPYLGYNKCSTISLFMKENNLDIFNTNQQLNFIDENRLIEILKAENLIQAGFKLKDLFDN